MVSVINKFKALVKVPRKGQGLCKLFVATISYLNCSERISRLAKTIRNRHGQLKPFLFFFSPFPILLSMLTANTFKTRPSTQAAVTGTLF